MGTVAHLFVEEDNKSGKTPPTRQKLTKTVVDAIEPPASGDIVVWDSELRGFGVRVKPSGVKTYIVQYRNAEGRSRRLSLGKHGSLVPDGARKLAKKQQAAVAAGADPTEERACKRNAATVAELAERYLREHAEQHNKPSTLKENRRLLDKRILPQFGTSKIEAIKQRDVIRFHTSLSKTRYEANRTLALLSKMFNLAERWGLRPLHSNPCAHVQRFKEEKRERFLSNAELAKLGEALEQADREKLVHSGVTGVLRLLILTGCRLGEIRCLRWRDVDLEARVLRLPDAKAGARPVRLGPEAAEILAGIACETRFVFPAEDGERPMPESTVQGGWIKIRKMVGFTSTGKRKRKGKGKGRENETPTAEGLPTRIHDLRHTYGTVAGRSGKGAFIIRDLMGHKTLAMTSRYVERDFESLSVHADDVSTQLARALRAKTGGGITETKDANVEHAAAEPSTGR